MRSAQACAWAASRASTMTRSTGSVPLARISTRPGCRVRARRPRAHRPSHVALSSPAAAQAHVDQGLRKQRQAGQQLRHRLAAAPAPAAPATPDDAVAGGVAVQREQMARTLAAEHPAALLQFLEHVAVADLGAHERARRGAAAPARPPCWSSACRPRREHARRARAGRRPSGRAVRRRCTAALRVDQSAAGRRRRRARCRSRPRAASRPRPAPAGAWRRPRR